MSYLEADTKAKLITPKLNESGWSENSLAVKEVKNIL
ncbi:type I restriction enzyme, R subunit [Hydrogenimonas thermophila]|uniref:Type I restriction enzyme, R subunit n=1 Tax=Hydrogenimonas thermophila TaxID=223786 RepID=A0A1I5MAS4_9BACT|nr:type I restriction enzyme, R subunit [Hydrogenimonas thermophila]